MSPYAVFLILESQIQTQTLDSRQQTVDSYLGGSEAKKTGPEQKRDKSGHHKGMMPWSRLVKGRYTSAQVLD